LEEDLRLKEQVAALEACLLVEQTERKNACRQRDNFKTKLEKTVGEKAGAMTRVAALEEENAQLKAKIAELPLVVAQERKSATEEALAGFMASAELSDIRMQEYRRGFDAGYEKHFITLFEKD
jgi:dynactin complex subunit